MKKLLTLRNLLVCAAFLLGLLVFIFSFVTNVKCYDSDGTLNSQFFNVVWGSKRQEGYVGSVTVEVKESYSALALPLIGALLVFLAAIAAVVLSLLGDKLVKDAKVRKIVMLVLAVLMIGGAVMIFLTTLNLFNVIAQKTYDELPEAYKSATSVEEIKKQMKEAGGSMKSAMMVVSGIMAIVGGLSVAASQFVPEK